MYWCRQVFSLQQVPNTCMHLHYGWMILIFHTFCKLLQLTNHVVICDKHKIIYFVCIISAVSPCQLGIMHCVSQQYRKPWNTHALSFVFPRNIQVCQTFRHTPNCDCMGFHIRNCLVQSNHITTSVHVRVYIHKYMCVGVMKIYCSIVNARVGSKSNSLPRFHKFTFHVMPLVI